MEKKNAESSGLQSAELLKRFHEISEERPIEAQFLFNFLLTIHGDKLEGARYFAASKPYEELVSYESLVDKLCIDMVAAFWKPEMTTARIGMFQIDCVDGVFSVKYAMFESFIEGIKVQLEAEVSEDVTISKEFNGKKDKESKGDN